MSEPDHPQKAHFSGVFHRASETYDAVGVDFFAPLAAQLVARADLAAGDSVLDLGCGRGAALFAAADSVDSSGDVLGIDLAPGMVERTALDVARHGLTQVRVELGDADHPPARDGGWDAVVASFVLFFLPDPVATAARVREVLRPGGRFVLSTFDVPDDRWKVVEGAVAPFWPPTDEPEPSHPATKSHFSSTAAVEELLADAGFVDIDTVLVEHVSVYRDVQQWLDWTWSAGARVIWERVPDADLEAAQAAAYDVVSGLAEPDGTLRERFTLRLHRAVAP
jgi:ubiquinone/menaquinone biosynthesis C-methylase UbiE